MMKGVLDKRAKSGQEVYVIEKKQTSTALMTEGGSHREGKEVVAFVLGRTKSRWIACEPSRPFSSFSCNTPAIALTDQHLFLRLQNLPIDCNKIFVIFVQNHQPKRPDSIKRRRQRRRISTAQLLNTSLPSRG